MLKRYDITGVHGRGGVFSAKAIETPDGEFIRYKDYMKEKVGNVPEAKERMRRSGQVQLCIVPHDTENILSEGTGCTEA